jgi:hypothetical protein
VNEVSRLAFEEHISRVDVRIVCFPGSMATPPILYLRFTGVTLFDLRFSEESIMKQSPGSISPKLGVGDKTMSLSENVRPLLAARAATDPNAARLLEMFAKADEILSERSLEKIVEVERPRLAQVPSGLRS